MSESTQQVESGGAHEGGHSVADFGVSGVEIAVARTVSRRVLAVVAFSFAIGLPLVGASGVAVAWTLLFAAILSASVLAAGDSPASGRSSVVGLIPGAAVLLVFGAALAFQFTELIVPSWIRTQAGCQIMWALILGFVLLIGIDAGVGFVSWTVT